MPSVISDPKIDKLMETFIPADRREWYPWVWPEQDFYRKATKKQVADFVEKVRHYARTDLFFFSDNITRNVNQPHLYIGFHDEICHIVQYGEDIGVLVSRGHLKSTIISGAYPVFNLGNNQNLRIMICTAVGDLAEALMSYIKLLIIRNRKVQMVFPNLKPAMDQFTSKPSIWNKDSILVERDMDQKDPSITTMGLDNQPSTGTHCDLMIYDDIMHPKNTDTPEKLRRAKVNWEHSLSLPDPGARSLYAGTRYNDLDIYGDLLKKARIPFYIRRGSEDEGKYAWPDKKNIARIEKMRIELSPFMFACQIQNDPIVEGDTEFEQSWIQRWDYDLLRAWTGKKELTDEEVFEYWTKTLDLHLGCDPNREGKGRRSDNGCVMVIGTNSKGHEFGLFVKMKKMRTQELIDSYVNAFEFWHPKTSCCETIGGDVHIFNAIKKELKAKELSYTSLREYENKKVGNEIKIKSLIFPMSQKMIWFGPGREWDEIVQEFLRFPYAAHDDGATTWALIHTQQAKPKREKKPEVQVGSWQQRQQQSYAGERDWQLG